MRYHFASDNTVGWCPEAIEAIEAANTGSVASYGDDELTRRAADAVRETFGTDCDVFLVFNGTAANSLSLASMCQPYHSIICHEMAHLETDECGAPEFFSGGAKVWLAGGDNAQLDPNAVRELATRRGDLHFPKPHVVSLTQSTELGTVYRPEQIVELSSVAAELGMGVHMDGARFANAVVSLGCSPADITWRAGVDVLSFGGTKNGMGMAELVVFFDMALSEEFAYRCKQAGQLASKMRFMAAPWASMLTNDGWLANARHANRMAKVLEQGLQRLGVDIMFPVESNAVFCRFDAASRRQLAERGWVLYDFIGGATRLMCSWATSTDDTDALHADLADILSG